MGIGKGAEQGILIKDAESLEIARKVDTIVLDKTGTITEGKPKVTDLVWTTDDKSIRQAFYSLEKQSEHPLATAVTDYLNTEILPVNSFESITGEGVKGRINGMLYLSGNQRMMEECKITIPAELQQAADRFKNESKTVIWFADEKDALAVAAITDRIKESSKTAIADLQKQGIEVVMLTGDNRTTAETIAKEAGIRRFEAEVLPQQKAEYVKKLQAEGQRVAMVGDGINDSAALAQADLSIAMGKGSDIAMDVAKMTIISSDLTKISDAIRLSVLTVRTIRENLFWAFIYNLIGVPIAAGILYPINGFLLNPMIAGATMAMSSVSVVTNSLRLRNKRIGQSCATSNNADPEPTAVEKVMEETLSMPQKTMQNPVVETETSIIHKEYKIEGMMCNHCRMHVEKALSTIADAKVTVTLDPPVAVVEYKDAPLSIEELQHIITEKAGDYTISENSFE